MSMLINRLRLEIMTGPDGAPLKSRSGRQLFMVAERFIYSSDLVGAIVVPEGFVTDLGSVPRLPLVYMFLGDRLHHEAVIHDYLYSKDSPVDRKTADAVLVEVCDMLGQPAWVSRLSWLGVRAMGWRNFEGSMG